MQLQQLSMQSDLNAILGEQHAAISLLSGRLLDEAGQLNRQPFDGFARALFAHLTVLRSVVLPALTDDEARTMVSEPAELASSALAHAIVQAQSNALVASGAAALVAAATGLITIERAVVPLSLLGLPMTRQEELGALADDVFARTIGPSDEDGAATRPATDIGPR